jgi:hypothetical protein
MLEVHAALKQELSARRQRFDELMGTDVAAFNRLLAEQGAQGVVVPR